MFRRSTISVVAGAGLLLTALTALSGGITAASAAPTTPVSAPSAAAIASDDDLLSMGVLAKATLLQDGKALIRSTPPPGGHAYRYSTTSQFWSVVAVDPDDHFYVDFHLYSDPEHTDLLARSPLDNLVAIDSNHRPLDQYYPQVDKSEYHGHYGVEQVQGSRFVANGYQNVPLLGKDFVTVYDTVLEAGMSYRFVLSATKKNMNGSMYLMGSDPDDPTSWVKPGEDFDAWATSYGGEAGYFDVTPSETDRFGLVIISDGDPGVFGLTKVTY